MKTEIRRQSADLCPKSWRIRSPHRTPSFRNLSTRAISDSEQSHWFTPPASNMKRTKIKGKRLLRKQSAREGLLRNLADPWSKSYRYYAAMLFRGVPSDSVKFTSTRTWLHCAIRAPACPLPDCFHSGPVKAAVGTHGSVSIDPQYGIYCQL